jgi:glycosyltransferase involved in cell wall biosynthesis
VRLFLHSDNAPITRRFNQAVVLARGEFVSFLYSDDYYLPAKLNRQVHAFDNLPPDYGVVYAPAQGLNDLTGERWTYGSIGTSGDILKDMFLRHERGQIDMISPMVRKACLQQYPFDEQIFAEGEAIFFRIATRYRFHYVDEPLAVIRDHRLNAGKAILRNAEMTMRWLDRLAEHPDFPASHRRFLEMYRATVWRNYGWQAIRTSGDRAWARQCFARAFRTEWRKAMHPRTFVGIFLSFIPDALGARLNRWGDLVRQHRHNSVGVDDFGGSIGKS